MNRFYMLKFVAGILLCLTLAGGSPMLYAQDAQHYTNAQEYFDKGLELMAKEKYAAARQAFAQHRAQTNTPNSSQAKEAHYLQALCALYLYHGDGERLMQDFIRQNPRHPNALTAYYALGSFFYKNQEYPQTIEYLEKVVLRNLNATEQANCRFMLGYSHLNKKNFAKAKEQFDVLKRSKNAYTPAASYYAGYLAYEDGDYERALFDLEKAETYEEYAAVVPYMIANIYYRQGRYDDLKSYADRVLEKKELKNRGEISLLGGEACFKQQDYACAAQRLGAYVQSKRSPANAQIQYRLAYSLFQSQQPAKALEPFKAVALGKDTLAQVASYYLGRIYLDQNNRLFAIPAFDKASKLTFNPEIAQESLYTLAILEYNDGNYKEAIRLFEAYKKQYPQSRFGRQVNELLSNAYLNTNDYDQALQHIESLANKTRTVRQAYQKVAFYRGTEYFNNSEFEKALQLFEKSLRYRLDRDVEMKAHFWTAETYSIGRYWNKAIAAYARVFQMPGSESSPLYLKSRYGIGYAYYNTQQYDRALTHFKSYVEGTEQEKKWNYADALIRLADCYYVNKVFSDALRVYRRAINEQNPDIAYATYQMGVLYGIQDNPQQANVYFNRVLNQYNRSRYFDDALFQSALVNFEGGRYQQAIQGFGRLEKQAPASNFIPFALERRALAYTNTGQPNQAINDYKRIIDEYTRHSTAGSAMAGLQSLLAQQGRNNEVQAYLDKYSQANPKDENLEKIRYDAAKNLFFNGSYAQAAESYEEFINNYSQSALAFEARYYMAESFFYAEQMEKAKATYYQVIEEDKISMVTRALRRVAGLEFDAANYQAAVKNYFALGQRASSKKDQARSWEGLMTSYQRLAKYDSVTYYADLILERGAVNVNSENKANLYKGKAAYAQGNYDDAVDAFLTTTNSAKDVNGAEAQYLIGEVFYQQGRYRESINTLIDLAKAYGSFEEWIGRAFLLIADNYVALEEYYQAQATLNSLIEKSPLSFIVEQAKERLKQVEQSANARQATPADSTTNQADSLKGQE